MSLLKIINARKNPIEEISNVTQGHCEHVTKMVTFRVKSNNPYENVRLDAHLGGDDEAAGSFTLRDAGVVLSQGSLHTRNQRVSESVRLPTNVSLELTIRVQAPTSRVGGRGEHFIVSTNCVRDERHKLALVGIMSVSLNNDDLNLYSSYEETAQVWAEEDSGGIGEGGRIL